MDFTFQALKNIRGIFKNIIKNNTLDTLNKIPKGFNNNIIWNIGHVVITEQALVYKLSGLTPELPDELINKYKKDSKPKEPVSQKEANEIVDLLDRTIRKTELDYANGVFKNYTPYTVSTTGNTLNNIEDALQFMSIHDGLHYGYVLALLKVIKS